MGTHSAATLTNHKTLLALLNALLLLMVFNTGEQRVELS